MRSAVDDVRGSIRSHPIAAFAVVAYTLSWGYWIPFALAGGTAEPGVGWPSHMPGLAGPAIAAVLVTAVVSGRTGLADLWQRLTRWRVGWWWMAVVAVLAAGALALAVAGGPDESGDLTLYNGVGAGLGPFATIAVVFVVNGVGEETGWRGFMADRLLQRHCLSSVALLVTLVWAPWHLPLFFFVGSFESFSPVEIVGWTLGLTAGSFVLTWLYRGSGASILLVAVWHTAFNFTSGTPGTRGAAAATTSTLVMAGAVAIAAADWWTGRRSS